MLPHELIEIAKTLDPSKGILCQVVAANGQAWNMEFKLFPANTNHKDFNVLRVSHPELESLPDSGWITGNKLVIDTCSRGHEYAKLPDHPLDKDGKPRCPRCMADSLDIARRRLSNQSGR